MKSRFETMQTRNSDYKFAYADIGVTPGGGINWRAPIVQELGIQGIPYFYIVDGNGQRVAQGEAALDGLK